MKNKKKYLGLLVFSIFFFQSCKKYLDKKSNSAFVVPVTLANFQAILDNTGRMNQAVTPSFCESSADDYFLLNSDYSTLDFYFMDVYIWKPADYNYQNDWGMCYNAIYNANLCLEGLAKIKQTPANTSAWKNVNGSALFFRAYYFLQLVWEYSKVYNNSTSNTDLGIVLKLFPDYNVPSSRATVKNSYQQIISDATEAATNLEDLPQHPMRPSKAAAYGLLAKTYWSMGQYDNALKYAELCLQIKSTLINYNVDQDINGSISNDIPFKAFNKEIIFYSSMNFAHYIHNPVLYARVDTLLYKTYENNDLRKVAFFQADGDYFRFKGNYNDDQSILFTGIAVDEMFLIKAECLARMNNVISALEVLNGLLAKRYDNTFIPVISINATQALIRITLERRKELLMRGLRWIDIKRQNNENANIVLKRLVNNQQFALQPNSNYYALPLPKDIINLSTIPQNPQ